MLWTFNLLGVIDEARYNCSSADRCAIYRYSTCSERRYIDINLDENIDKYTFILKSDIPLENTQKQNYDFDIIQTAESSLISKNKFYSICTITSFLPDINYIFLMQKIV